MVRTTNEKIAIIIKRFKQLGIPFRMEYTNQRTEIYSKVANYSNKESEFPPSELNFIRKVKDSIIKNELYNLVPNKFTTKESKEKIRYYVNNTKYNVDEMLKDCVEIDLRSAYWEMAYRLGLLTEEIYEQGKTISKGSRLAAIGSLAKVTGIMEFDGKQEHELPSIKSELTEFLWDTICYKVGKLMNKSARAAGKDFIFVWVDAMFIRKKAVPAVKKIFREAGFDFSIEPVTWIKFEKSKIRVKGKGKWITIDQVRVWKDERDFPIKVGPNEVVEIPREIRSHFGNDLTDTQIREEALKYGLRY